MVGEPDSLSLRERVRVRESILKARARLLRANATDAEKVLWRQIRGRRLEGYKFRRQAIIEPYIVDFVCYEARIIIELDGGQHLDQKDYDNRRTILFRRMGYRVLRFWNDDVLNEIHSVTEIIRKALIDFPSPQPSPGGRGGRTVKDFSRKSSPTGSGGRES